MFKGKDFFSFFYTHGRTEMWEGLSEPCWKGQVAVRIFLLKKKKNVVVRNWQLS